MTLPTVLSGSIATRDGGRVLLAQRCHACGVTTFPVATQCPRCGTDAPEPVELASPARVFSWTVIHRAAAGLRTPYVVALADFDAGPRLFAQVDAPAETMHSGMAVDLAFGSAPAGAPADAYYFVPTEP